MSLITYFISVTDMHFNLFFLNLNFIVIVQACKHASLLLQLTIVF